MPALSLSVPLENLASEPLLGLSTWASLFAMYLSSGFHGLVKCNYFSLNEKLPVLEIEKHWILLPSVFRNQVQRVNKR